MNQSILNTLRALIIEHFDVPADSVTDDQEFAAMGLDSLGLVEFIFQVEDRYQVVVDYEQAMAQPTLAGLAALLERLTGGPNAIAQAA